ncbi:MAG: 50S ribosomal protein L34e [Candidatus Heimdallarchaeota archaeon]
MPTGKEKSHSLRRTKYVTPGARARTHYTRRPSKRDRCRVCGGVLHASRKLTRNRVNTLSKTERRAERPFGGDVCGRCLRAGIAKAVRKSSSSDSA